MPKGRGKTVILRNFLDPGSPKLASGLPGPPNCLGVKEPARLSELQVHQVPFFAINRHEEG